MKRAIMLQTGMPFPFWAMPSPGLFRLRDELAAIYPDRTQTWMEIRTYDYHVEPDVEAILSENPESIIHISHSFGTGHGLKNFCQRLHERGRRLDLACIVDAVEDVAFTNWRREEPFPLPGVDADHPSGDIDMVVAARTLNHSAWYMPWGRDIEHPNRVAYIEFPTDSVYHHDTVDSAQEFHDMAIAAIAALDKAA